MKRKGINTILKSGPYTTGRLTAHGEETLKIKRLSRDEWVSEEPFGAETVPQNVPNFGEDRAGDAQDGTGTTFDGEPEEKAAEGQSALIEALEAQNALLREILRKAA